VNSLEQKLPNNKVVCGIDEAGRGPVLGPMIICGICFKESNLSFLTEIGVKDSKKLTKEKRAELAKVLKEKAINFKLIKVTCKEIDDREQKRISLNKLEQLKMVKIINKLKPDIIYIDAADVNEDRFGKLIKRSLSYCPEKIISKHKADDLFPIVSAASILAKNRRDGIIDDLRKEYIELGYNDCGSGYTSDGRSVSFLRDWIKKHKKPPKFARRSWETTKKILEEEVYTKKLTDF
jgi:ribonuclease HII